jgi:membrane-associated phospholipid phosphatase
MFVVGSLVFGLLAYNVATNGPLLAWDIPVANSLHATALNSPTWVNWIMIAGYYVGDQLVAAIGIVLGVYFLRRRYWQELTMLANGFGVSALLFLLLSHIFNRPRPIFESQIWRIEPIPGFPSGHAIAVVASYGLLVYFLLPKISSRAGKAWLVAGTLLVGLYVLFSRAFLGDHFLTDLVAGCAVGLAWSGLAHTVVELIFRKRTRVAATSRAGLAFPR